jgi:acetylornithine deacetylase/succinyl-diaminopimelate desuccinylase-like protein
MTVVGLLESVDWLLSRGFQPKRTTYLAFGQDEEIGGLQGAGKKRLPENLIIVFGCLIRGTFP